ncbi:3-deoxy-manno-octulosonate cytidylyltransferase (CMP-KDO synthetase) [Verrucomicrobium sp. GAS474]|uniref:3-deoxy-manno-octulosonate cytidylyltransferase n=1 Tax=Verrucomicrobium sp. GAS474 TaxID=1882831 RepID=UPI00087D18EA|nr:3-deoxy-manno-octulosonate cytidylyltransferase [Verrucomicrobium sp. GAS474]SDU08895.1 3-deoxy-manno-octulosonate cytidylyltransferase (CMP-KDO synthetase) [Verrucomicrobium sp. GAS474]
MKTVIVIPARYGSTRFPGKPLVLIRNKPLVQWVWERAKKSRLASGVVVATDDERIYRAVEYFGGDVVMTSPGHPSGTDRIAEVARKPKWKADLYLNVQGDEPLIVPREIDRLIEAAAASKAEMATLAHLVETEAEAANPNVVKVVRAANGDALYFSRSPIPFWRDRPQGKAKPKKGAEAPVLWRHIGVYAYRAAALRRFVTLSPGTLEKAESLEQLRALENGMRITVVPTKMRCQGVDAPADLALVQKLLK